MDAFFALLEVWEFGQASFLAARLRGRQMRLSASLQQLARCEEQYLSMEFVEQRFLPPSVVGHGRPTAWRQHGRQKKRSVLGS